MCRKYHSSCESYLNVNFLKSPEGVHLKFLTLGEVLPRSLWFQQTFTLVLKRQTPRNNGIFTVTQRLSWTFSHMAISSPSNTCNIRAKTGNKINKAPHVYDDRGRTEASSGCQYIVLMWCFASLWSYKSASMLWKLWVSKYLFIQVPTHQRSWHFCSHS